jgi:DNA-binding transcriptional ArsR family regulator
LSDNVAFDPGKLDKLIHSPVRLAAVAALHAGGEESFSNLKKVAGTTDGNLTIHMKVLEESGIVKVRKRFVDRRPRTTYRLTRKGRQVFREYVACMAKMVEQYDHQMAPRG